MKLLIGYDNSPACTTALHDLRNAGLPETGEALLLSVADLFMPLYPPDAPFNTMDQSVVIAEEQAGQRRDALLHEAQNAALLLKEELPGWTVRAEAAVDAPARGLLKYAQEWSADLLCIGAPHSSRLERLFFGSICEKAVTHAPCTVRVGRAEAAGHPLRIMLATDGSPDARTAEQTITCRRWPAGTEVLVVFVHDTRNIPFAGELYVPPAPEPADENLTAVTRRLTAAGLVAQHQVRHGIPGEELLAAAAEWHAHCIFAGASGMGAFERFLVGSVSSALAARAGCSVEIVRRRQPAAG